MRKVVLFLICVALFIGVGFVLYLRTNDITIINPLAKPAKNILQKPLEKYSFENLRTRLVPSEKIAIGDVVKEEVNFSSRTFSFYDPSASSGQVKKVSGLINLPTKEGAYPVIVMFRGFVDKEIYTPGEGTRRTAEEFAKNGFITLAPDFLGYGQSDMPSNKAIEERFQTYTTALSLLSAIPTLNIALSSADIKSLWDAKSNYIGIWGHSNGGHIALSVLAIIGKPYPTVLWAPVSKPFPYSILYFTDEYDDHGKMLRKVVADFEKDYDAEKYSVTNYLDWIKAPVELHQGVEDEAVPKRWSDQLEEELTKQKIDVSYFVYPGENHNFNNGSWPLAVGRSVVFYNKHFSKESPY